MTTITIKENKSKIKNTFNTIEEMIQYFVVKTDIGILYKLPHKELTLKRLKDYEEVETMKKEDFIYLK